MAGEADGPWPVFQSRLYVGLRLDFELMSGIVGAGSSPSQSDLGARLSTLRFRSMAKRNWNRYAGFAILVTSEIGSSPTTAGVAVTAVGMSRATSATGCHSEVPRNASTAPPGLGSSAG